MDVLLIPVMLNSLLGCIVWLRFHASIGRVNTLVNHGLGGPRVAKELNSEEKIKKGTVGELQ